jgi:uncharacterized protein (TIGR02466 family)
MKKIINAFSLPVLEAELENTKLMNASLLSEITSLFSTMDDKRLLSYEWNNFTLTDIPNSIGYSSFNHSNLVEDIKFQSLFQLISPLIDEFFEQLSYTGSWKFENAWANVYPTGAYVPHHNHAMSHWSGVYYVSAPDACGDLILLDPKEYSLSNEPKGFNFRGNTRMTVKSTTGKVVMFPGYLKHETMPNQSEANRIAISFNIAAC